jgi:hypothetical protein
MPPSTSPRAVNLAVFAHQGAAAVDQDCGVVDGSSFALDHTSDDVGILGLRQLAELSSGRAGDWLGRFEICLAGLELRDRFRQQDDVGLSPTARPATSRNWRTSPRRSVRQRE